MICNGARPWGHYNKWSLQNCPADTYPPFTIPHVPSPLLISYHLYHFAPCHFHLCQVPTPLPSTMRPPLFLLLIFLLHITSIPLHLSSCFYAPHVIFSLIFPSMISHMAISHPLFHVEHASHIVSSHVCCQPSPQESNLDPNGRMQRPPTSTGTVSTRVFSIPVKKLLRLVSGG
jgi:hypothetical protein